MAERPHTCTCAQSNIIDAILRSAGIWHHTGRMDAYSVISHRILRDVQIRRSEQQCLLLAGVETASAGTAALGSSPITYLAKGAICGRATARGVALSLQTIAGR